MRAPSNNCTISPTDKWISRGGARTVGACTAPREEQGPPHMLRHVRLPHDRCPNLWQPAASQLNPSSFHKTIQTPRCPQQLPIHSTFGHYRDKHPQNLLFILFILFLSSLESLLQIHKLFILLLNRKFKIKQKDIR